MRLGLATAPIYAMLALAGASLASPAHAWEESSAPQQSWTFTTIRGVYEYTTGMREGLRTADGALVGVPYVDHVGSAEFELEHYDGRGAGNQEYPDFLGVALGLRFIARIGGVAQSEWEHPAGVTAATGPTGWAAPFRLSLGAGTLAQIVRDTDFVLAAHFSLDFYASRSTWAQDVAFTVYPGLRMVWQPSPLRLQLGYDFLPFWIGQGRLEHRASAAAAVQLGSIGLGVRFTLTVGQERRAQGGLDDWTYGGALELVM